MDNTQIFSITQEVSARLELAAKGEQNSIFAFSSRTELTYFLAVNSEGVPNVEAMSPAQALKAVHPLRVATYLASGESPSQLSCDRSIKAVLTGRFQS